MLENAIIIYWSKTVNTQKVAYAVKKGLEEEDVTVEIKQVQDAKEVDFFNYDLVCIGSPSYQWSPPEELDEYLQKKFNEYSDEVKLGASRVEGRNALIFCTYSGPHTGRKEAVPVVKYIGQFFEHLGYKILDEIYVLSQHHGSKEISTQGKMGDIRNLPTDADLEQVKYDVREMISYHDEE